MKYHIPPQHTKYDNDNYYAEVNVHTAPPDSWEAGRKFQMTWSMLFDPRRNYGFRIYVTDNTFERLLAGCSDAKTAKPGSPLRGHPDEPPLDIHGVLADESLYRWESHKLPGFTPCTPWDKERHDNDVEYRYRGGDEE